MTPQKKLLTEGEVSEMLGLNVTTLQGWRHKGIPPRFLKVGRKVFYDAHDIQDYLASCARTITEHKYKGRGRKKL